MLGMAIFSQHKLMETGAKYVGAPVHEGEELPTGRRYTGTTLSGITQEYILKWKEEEMLSSTSSRCLCGSFMHNTQGPSQSRFSRLHALALSNFQPRPI